MFNISAILPFLEKRVGWKATNTPHVLDPDNIESQSSLFFQDSHAAISLKRIYETMEMPEYDGYSITEEQFNNHLKETRRSSILSVISGVFSQPELLEQSIIWDSDNTDRSIATINAQYVGYRIKVATDIEKFTSINSVSFNFASDCTVELELYHSTAGILWQKSFDCIANKEAVFLINDLVVNFTDEKYKSGEFFLRYKPYGLNWINPNFINWARTFNIGVEPFQMVNDNITPRLDLTFGVNFKYSTVKDFTSTIIDNAGIFDRAIMLSVAVRVLEQYIYSDRSNKSERLIKDVDALANDLNLSKSNGQYFAGLKKQLVDEINELKNNFFRNPLIVKVSPYVGSKKNIRWHRYPY